MAAAIPAFMGCSAPSEHPSTVPYEPPTTGSQVVTNVAHGSCEEGAERKCSVILGKFEGVTSCFVGVQFCVDAVWGPCQDPATGTVAPNSGGAGGQGAGGGTSGGSGGAAPDGSSGGAGGAG